MRIHEVEAGNRPGDRDVAAGVERAEPMVRRNGARHPAHKARRPGISAIFEGATQRAGMPRPGIM